MLDNLKKKIFTPTADAPAVDTADANQTKKAKRAAQARINGSRSQGPTTEEGKAASSKNALKHGFAAKLNILIEPDDSDAWDAHRDGYRNSYCPSNYAEADLVDQLASISWRQSRLVGIETALIDLQLSFQEDTVDAQHPLEKGNPRLHLALAWQSLAREPLPRVVPADPNDPIDPTLPPDELDIRGIELVRRYQVSLDRQFRNTLLNLTQFRKTFASPQVSTPPQQQQPPIAIKPAPPQPNEPIAIRIATPKSPASRPTPTCEIVPIATEEAA